MKNLIKVSFFLFIIFVSNFFLLRPGSWFFQDTSYWYKNYQELWSGLSLQLLPLLNNGYYLGYDVGLFGSTRIISVLLSFILFILFGSSLSQALFTIIGLVVSFFSFYFFSGILLENKNIRYVLSLLFTFSPLIISAEGYTVLFAGIPLFLYSFYKYFSKDDKTRFIYLLLNIIGSYLILSYIRYIEIGFIIILFYGIYFLLKKEINLSLKKIFYFVLAYILLFLPSIFSLAAQLLEKSNTAFNYATVFANHSQFVNFINSFNYFYSFNVTPYENNYFFILGVITFIIIFVGLVRNKKFSSLLILNLFIFLTGITLYGLNNIFNNFIFNKLITFFPLIVNGPYWAFFISSFSLPIIIGLVFGESKRLIYIISVFIIVISIIPFLNFNQFEFRKYKISDIPKPYLDYFVKPFYGIPEATQYIPGTCWRAEYMQKADVPTMCINFGLHYSPISFANPRLLSGKDYLLSVLLNNKTSLNNLRVTHNLKDIIVANDIVKTKGPGPLTNNEDIRQIKEENIALSENSLLSLNPNPNFNFYYFKNKNDYDFYIYSPKTVVRKLNLNDIFDNSLNIYDRPVVVDNNQINLNKNYQSANISYKSDPLNSTKYYVKIADVDFNKPFLIQMNQSFNTNWKLYFSNESEFNQASCKDKWAKFSITNNNRCQYNDPIINLSDIKFLSRNPVAINTHFEGNFIGNGWVINPNNIPDNLKKNKDIYIVIVYEKQIYYSYAILIAGVFFILLIAASLLQEINSRLRKYN